MNHKIKAAVFDLDGTLSDSLASIWKSANLAIGAFGFAPFEKERYKYFVGDGADELLRRCLKNAGDGDLKYFDRVKQEYRRIFEQYCMYQVQPYDGITELLKELKQRGLRLAVLSNKPHARTLDVIHALFGEDCFDWIQGQTPELERKPSPDGVFYIAKRLDISPSEMLYVGDTNTDMQTGKAAGALTIGVLWGFRERAELEDNHADAVIAHPAELIQVLEGAENDAGGSRGISKKELNIP